jgi:hypothetical protein
MKYWECLDFFSIELKVVFDLSYYIKIMKFDLDTTIIIGFLITNLIFGLFSGRGIKSIKEYAIGSRNFSTATIWGSLRESAGNYVKV